MKKILLTLVVAACALTSVAISAGEGRGNRVASRFARVTPWNGPYYHTQYGYPIGLVVPPRASMQSKYQWGVSGTEMLPIYHQFGRAYPGEYQESSTVFRPTPNPPSHTDQFGVYYIRGPW